jgi:hypothetical protein
MNKYLRQIAARTLPGAAFVRPRLLSVFEPPSQNVSRKRALDLHPDILADTTQIARDGEHAVTRSLAPSPPSPVPGQLPQKPASQTLMPEGRPKGENEVSPASQSRALTDASLPSAEVINQDLQNERSNVLPSQPQRSTQNKEVLLHRSSKPISEVNASSPREDALEAAMRDDPQYWVLQTSPQQGLPSPSEQTRTPRTTVEQNSPCVVRQGTSAVTRLVEPTLGIAPSRAVEPEQPPESEPAAQLLSNGKPGPSFETMPIEITPRSVASLALSLRYDRSRSKMYGRRALEARAEAAPNNVQVTIGRVEVRAAFAVPAVGRPPRAATPLMSLAEYLRRRDAGRHA